MIKRLAYIVMLLIFAAGLSSAKIITKGRHAFVRGEAMRFIVSAQMQKDTTKKHQPEDDSKKIKEISKAKRQSKPEKIGEGDKVQDEKVKIKPKRQRRPEGLDRPPEIPRRNNN